MRMITVDVVNQLDIGMIVVAARNLIRVSVIVSSHLNEEQIRGLVALHIEVFGLVAKEFTCTTSRIRCLVPIPVLRFTR